MTARDTFPTADQVATAIVTAARLTGESPVACIAGEGGMHCRCFALEALKSVFPEARVAGLARCVGFNPATYGGSMASAKIRSWWSDEFVDEVVGALVPESEERAA